MGSHSGSILLSANGISSLVPVTLTVEAYCTYSLVPSSYSAGAGPASGFFGIAVNPTCSWTAVSNDSWIILTSPASGIGGSPVTFQLQANTGPARTGSITVAGQSSLIHQAAAPGVTSGYRFVPVVPCRLLDTRLANGPFGGPRLQANETRSFTLPATNCGVPANAAAYSLNATVVPAGRLSYLTLWPSGQSQPHVSTLNSFDGRIKANAAIVPAGTAGAVSVFVTDPTDVVLDINGYFIPAAAGGSSFYSVPYCRMYFQSPLDPTLAAGETMTFTRYCSPVQSATAYSLNVSVKPAGPLGFLTLWSADQPQPFVSTLNSPTGTVTSNAAIVAVGASGAINAFVTNTTEVSLHLNGFFGPPGLAGELLFHPVKPCRIADTRLDQGPLGGPALPRVMPRSFPVSLSSCGIPNTARSYSLNVTLVPIESTAQVTLGPGVGVAFIPYAYLLESFDGSVISSAAIIPADSSGGIGAWAFQTTHLILDINGYFQ